MPAFVVSSLRTSHAINHRACWPEVERKQKTIRQKLDRLDEAATLRDQALAAMRDDPGSPHRGSALAKGTHVTRALGDRVLALAHLAEACAISAATAGLSHHVQLTASLCANATRIGIHVGQQARSK